MATAAASADSAPRRWRLRLPERLPNLKGRWLTLYTIVWAILLPLSLIGATRGTYIILTNPNIWSPYGFITTEDSNGIHVDAVRPAARPTGLAPGDYVVAIDGWQVPKTAARASATPHLLKPDGSWTIFTVRKASGEHQTVRLIRSHANEEQELRAAGLSSIHASVAEVVGALLMPVMFIFAGILLFMKRRREAVPALLSMSFLMTAGIYNAGDQIGVSFYVIGAIGAAATIFLFAALLAFPSGRFEPQWTAVPFLLLPLPLFIPSDALVLGVGIGLLYSLLIVAALISRYRKVEQTERLQLRWAFMALGVGMFLMMLTIFLAGLATSQQAADPQWLQYYYTFGRIFNGLGPAIIALGLIVSILKYRLYDAGAVMGQSAAYGALTLGFVVLFAGSQKIIELLGEEYLGRNIGALAGGIGAALAAVAIAPMYNRSQRWAERRFQNSLYRLRHGLPALVGDLRETSGVEQIAGATLDSLVEGVQASRAAMVAGDQLVDARKIPAEEVEAWRNGWSPPAHDGFDIERSDELFPVRVPLEAEGHGRVGWLLLGARPDGSLFGRSECAALEEIAEPVARAVQVALSRQEREARYEQRFDQLERRIETIAALIENPLRDRRRPSVN